MALLEILWPLRMGSPHEGRLTPPSLPQKHLLFPMAVSPLGWRRQQQLPPTR